MDLTRFRTLGEHVMEREDALLDGVPADEQVRRAVAERAATRVSRTSQARTRGARLVLALAACGAAAGAMTFVFFSAPRSIESALSFTVGEPPRAGVLHEWVSAPSSSELPLRFSDGSRASLLPSSRGRVVRLSPSGAEIVVEAGRALVEVVPHQGADYRLRTGPFDVEITGTRFVAAWNPVNDEFELDLEEGRVLVRGCGLGDGVKVEAGQRLEATCNPAKFSVRPRGESQRAAPAAARGAEAAPPAAPAPALAAPPEAPTERARSGGDTREPAKSVPWPTLARQGHFRRAYETAAASGFEAECARCAADELLLLGDTARLSGHADHARQAYLSLRQRFAGTTAAAQAAFHLGRLAGGDRWFETYLTEQPTGPLAEAALGRLLEAGVQRGDVARARALAKTYLERHPAGAHADQAREILGALRSN